MLRNFENNNSIKVLLIVHYEPAICVVVFFFFSGGNEAQRSSLACFRRQQCVSKMAFKQLPGLQSVLGNGTEYRVTSLLGALGCKIGIRVRQVRHLGCQL